MEASSDFKSIPIFPPWCVEQVEEKKCTAFGITVPCVATPNNHDIFGPEVVIGHWLTTLALVGIGLINLSYVQFPFNRADTMQIITSFYSISTGIFALLRINFGLSRFLLMAAATHNLAEWCILMMIAAVNTSVADIETNIQKFVFYIYGVIVLVVMMPTLLSAVVVEQSTGISVDYTLTFIFLYMSFKKTNRPEVRAFYKLPAIAHTVHLLFTILPLVCANFHSGFTSWYNSFYLETAVYISAPITHILYMVWSHKFDQKKNLPDDKDKKGLLPADYRVKNIKYFVGVSIICGLLTVVGIPMSLGPCPVVHSCKPTTEIIGTSVAIVQPDFDLAFEDYIHTRELETKARAFKGNNAYSLVKDVQHPHTYRFIERWASKEHLDAWLVEAHKVFSEPALMNLLVGSHLEQFGGYMSVISSHCRNVTNGGVTINVNSSCDKVWSVVSDWADCRWVFGCQYAVIDPATNIRRLHMYDGSTLDTALLKLDHENLVLVYEITSHGSLNGYVGNVHIGATGNVSGCNILYQFALPKSVNVDLLNAVYFDFLEHRVPGVQKLFNK